MNVLVLIVVVWVVGVGTFPILKGAQNRLLTLATKAWWLGWIWVVLGPGGLRSVSWRYYKWKVGMNKCIVCGRRVNTVTQNGVTHGADENGIFVRCPNEKLSEERRL